MPDGKTHRSVRVDKEGWVMTVPNVVKQVSFTKAVAAGGDNAEDVTDVLSESTTIGTPWTFADVARETGGSGYITKAIITTQAESQTARLTLFLFTTPNLTCVLNDDVLNTAPDIADIASYQGKIDFPALEMVATASDSNTMCTPSTVGGLPLAFTCATGDASLYGVLVTRDAITTLTATESVTIALTIEQM